VIGGFRDHLPEARLVRIRRGDAHRRARGVGGGLLLAREADQPALLVNTLITPNVASLHAPNTGMFAAYPYTVQVILANGD
jgi:hypothetical protein